MSTNVAFFVCFEKQMLAPISADKSVTQPQSQLRIR